ncbi:MAG: hypothetical protein QXZ25_04975 [Candidatus Bathyarchaeia archaeon]
MKRIVVWVDSEDQDAKQICEKLKKVLSSAKLSHTIIDVRDIKLLKNEK